MIKLMTVFFVYIQYWNISNSSWIFQTLAAEQLQTRASGTVCQGKRNGPSITTQISAGSLSWSPPASQAGFRVGSSLWPSDSLVQHNSFAQQGLRCKLGQLQQGFWKFQTFQITHFKLTRNLLSASLILIKKEILPKTRVTLQKSLQMMVLNAFLKSLAKRA